jgi:acyl-coenzyme A synthetase/AMP-(fatty) acid ligase
MKNMPKFVLALTAFAAIGASAQTVYSGQADQERRDRNREEALSAYRGTSNTSATTTSERKSTVREKGAEVVDSTRRGAHKAADATRRVTHKSANTVRRVGHKTAEKARDITNRTNAKFGTSPKGNANPEGINPVGTSSASPTAPSNGTTK